MSDLLKEIKDLQTEINTKQAQLDEKKAALTAQLKDLNIMVDGGWASSGNVKFAVKAPKAAAKAPKAAGKGGKGKRGEQSAKIIAALSKPMKTGDIKAAIDYTGSNLSAVLSLLRKADKIDKNKAGEWFAVKK